MAFDHVARREDSQRTASLDIGPNGLSRAAAMRPPIPIPDAKSGCLAVLFIIVGLPLFLGLATIANCVALDRLGWVDFGEPNYIREAKPPAAHLIAREHCCGGSMDGSGVTQFFYGTDMPFEEVVAHYRAEMAKRGYASGTSSSWLSHREEVWFDTPGRFGGRSFSICFSITPFTNDYKLLEGLSGGDSRGLKSELSEYAHPYVALYTSSAACGA